MFAILNNKYFYTYILVHICEYFYSYIMTDNVCCNPILF